MALATPVQESPRRASPTQAPRSAARETSRFTNDDERWAAIERRDRTADGVFLFAVRTTGIYCRPSCGARRPLRQNVRFFNDPPDAERAGYRPCQRCRPKEIAPLDAQIAAVEAACRLIAESDDPPRLADLARAVGMSRFHFHRVFRSVMGVTPRAYSAAQRAQRVRDELAKSGTVTQAIYGAGYRSNGHFYADSADTLGMTPTAYRAGGVGETIRFAVGACSLGSVLVAATAKGICAIQLGDHPDELVRTLHDRFPNAELRGDDPDFADVVAKVVGLVEAPGSDLDLPLDLRGTAFQRRVWEALRRLPAGSRLSYSEVAERIGAPQAVRAVASACAANEIAVAIPCHRVVRRDGSLSNYRWGVERKRALLERESRG